MHKLTLHLFVTVLLSMLICCTSSSLQLTYSITTIPVISMEALPNKILLLNMYKRPQKKIKEDRSHYIIALTDSLMRFTYNKLHMLGIHSKIIQGYTAPETNRDSMVYVLLKKHAASHGIVITSLDAFFDQTHVDVTKDIKGTKDRTAYYDIVSVIGFAVYDSDTLIKEMKIRRNYFHSTRDVISGLLALGPDMNARKKDIQKITMENNQEFLNYFFPGEQTRKRVVFTGKEFAATGKAIAKADYEAAMIENLRLINDANKSIAARANYNCAVLSERKNQLVEAGTYLSRSLALTSLIQAVEMQKDFETANAMRK